jgi:hypothetical protein
VIEILVGLFLAHGTLVIGKWNLSTNAYEHKQKVSGWLRVGSGSSPSRLRVVSGSAPGRFWVGSGWVPGRLRVHSPGRFRVGSESVPGRLQVGSEWAPGGFRVGSGQVGLDLAHPNAAQNGGAFILISEPNKNRARDHKTTYTNKDLTAYIINAIKDATYTR